MQKWNNKFFVSNMEKEVCAPAQQEMALSEIKPMKEDGTGDGEGKMGQR